MEYVTDDGFRVTDDQLDALKVSIAARAEKALAVFEAAEKSLSGLTVAAAVHVNKGNLFAEVRSVLYCENASVWGVYLDCGDGLVGFRAARKELLLWAAPSVAELVASVYRSAADLVDDDFPNSVRDDTPRPVPRGPS